MEGKDALKASEQWMNWLGDEENERSLISNTFEGGQAVWLAPDAPAIGWGLLPRRAAVSPAECLCVCRCEPPLYRSWLPPKVCQIGS